jgi:hypothetical protein
VEELTSERSGDKTHNKHRLFVYWVSRSHGVRFLPWGYERFGPVATTPNPQAVRAREWLREFRYWQDIADTKVPKSAFAAFIKELRCG